MNWYYPLDEQRIGPLSQEQLADLVAQGVIQPDTSLWRESMVNWQPAREAAPALFDSLVDGAAVPPPVDAATDRPSMRAPILDLFDDESSPPIASLAPEEPSFFAHYRWGLLCAAIIVACVLGMYVVGFLRIPDVMIKLRLVASTGFVLLAVVGGAHRANFGRFVLVGLVGCWVGDYFMDRGGFAPGALAFLVGHLFFTAAFCVRGVSLKWAASALIAMIPVSTGLFLFFNPHVPPEHRLIVPAYIGVISLMVAMAWGSCGARRSVLIPLGALVFYLSDILVAAEAFLHVGRIAAAVCAPLYYGSVAFLAFTVYEREE